MYLLPQVRGQGLGRYLLACLETEIQRRGFHHIWIETASVLKEACRLYESSGYLPATGVENTPLRPNLSEKTTGQLSPL